MQLLDFSLSFSWLNSWEFQWTIGRNTGEIWRETQQKSIAEIASGLRNKNGDISVKKKCGSNSGREYYRNSKRNPCRKTKWNPIKFSKINPWRTSAEISKKYCYKGIPQNHLETFFKELWIHLKGVPERLHRKTLEAYRENFQKKKSGTKVLLQRPLDKLMLKSWEDIW